MSEEFESLLARADRAAAARDFETAQSLLREAADQRPGDLSIPLRLAGVLRGSGQPKAALDAIRNALAIAPLDFTALLMKASLLEAVNDPGAGEAWGHALAQKPETALPAQLAAAVSHGEALYAAWLDQRESKLRAAMASSESRADAEERNRIDRFLTNALRRTKHFHSDPTHYFFPNLAEREFHPRGLFPWLEELESHTEAIAADLDIVMNAERAELVPYIQYANHLPLRQWKSLNRNADWTAIHLLKNGQRIDSNAGHCHAAMTMLEKLPQPRVRGASPNAMYSLLAPHTAIPPHVGISNTRLVCHLPLIVPDGCWFRVGGETREWRRGEAFVFDDTIEHEAMNPTDELRVVFIFDIWHPDLTAIEREAVAQMIAADGLAASGL